MKTKKNVAYSSRTADKFVVRLPEGMRDRIAEVARAQHRSMNSEIVARLESSLEHDGVLIQNDDLNLDSTELTHYERELLVRFRQLAQRQQNALLSLIAQDANGQ
ncbi:MAG TPA: Arc family DNA-binding protein [Thiopseudomonas sp.]|nr:Arc family DNA-binding protein [Thiopseudomonas sp.]